VKAIFDPRLDAYIAEAAPFARPVLRHLRKLVRRACPAAEETLKWNSPAYVHGGKILCITPAFKAHCRLVFWSQPLKRLIQAERCGARKGMEQFGRITSLADLPDDRTMLRYLRTAAALTVSGKPARPRPPSKPRSAPAVPADLAAALKTNPAAALTFKKLSPSCRREYTEWLTDAKRAETRAKRLATALGWLAEGKPRNWKYQSG
jgi:uncharacterized protein YdeI (YjbR/CyaY-like superfamily)